MISLRAARAVVCKRPFRRFTLAIPRTYSTKQKVLGTQSLLQHLKERELVETITGPEGSLDKFVAGNCVVTYAGVDPTSSSLHVGHLLPLMNLLHFYLNGHHSIALIGKATATVGDPSGRANERDSIEARRLQEDFDKLWRQIERYFERGKEYALGRGYEEGALGTWELATNGEWLGTLGLVEFLDVVGRHVRVSQMLARESVKGRMESGQGINFSEFTYQLLQSYDFWHLQRTRNCRLQIGGNDQYGNITAGIDLINKLSKLSSSQKSDSPKPDPNEPAYGLTSPLLTTSSGTKLGKSAGNAIWLDETMTSPFELYQYFARLPDDAVERALKMFTLLPLPEIAAVTTAHRRAPEMRQAQHKLAWEVVALIHGEDKAARAERQTRILFPVEEGRKFSAEEIVESFRGDKRMAEVPRAELVGELLVKVLRRVGAVATKQEAANVVRMGGLYVGPENRRVENVRDVVAEDWLMGGEVLLVRVGKGRVVIVRGI